MQTLARLFVAACQLLEAEGRLCKRWMVRILTAVCLGAVCLALLLAGIGFLLYGLFVLLAAALTPAGAALVLGSAMVAAALITIVWIGKRLR